MGKGLPARWHRIVCINHTMLCTRLYLYLYQSTVAMKDGNGQQVYSAPATVQDGGDSGYGAVDNLSGPLLMICSNHSCVNRDIKEGKEASASGPATK